MLDLAEKAVTVTHLKSKDQQNAYIARLKAADKPDLGKKTGTSLSVEEITDKDFKPKSVSPPKKSRAGRTQARNHVVPKACKLNVSNAKILEIYTELRTLLLAKHPHAIAVLLRVFLETSVDQYLTAAATFL